MKFHHIAQEAGQALRSNKLRSSLTIVGIVVGIFAVTAMLALGEGLTQNVVGRISSFTQGDVFISGELSRADLSWVMAQPYVEAAVGTVQAQSATVIVNGSDFDVSVSVMLGDLKGTQSFTIEGGRIFDIADPEYRERVALATKTLDDAVLKETGSGVLGRTVSVNGQQYEVVGLIGVESPGFSRTDGTVYVPYATAIGVLTSGSNFSTIGVKLRDQNYYEVAAVDLLAGLNTARYLEPESDDLFNVSSAQSIIESVQETVGMISAFLGVVGGIALFVGGVGTMNMMLTTVSERTKEIGLRKAIGARRRDILLQVLVESVFLTVLGGIIGVVLTYLLAEVANSVLPASTNLSVIVSFRVVLFATAVAFMVGVVFGLYPANRASKLQPVDALRAE